MARVGLKYASDKAHEMLLLRSLHVMIKRDPHVPIKNCKRLIGLTGLESYDVPSII